AHVEAGAGVVQVLDQRLATARTLTASLAAAVTVHFLHLSHPLADQLAPPCRLQSAARPPAAVAPAAASPDASALAGERDRAPADNPLRTIDRSALPTLPASSGQSPLRPCPHSRDVAEGVRGHPQGRNASAGAAQRLDRASAPGADHCDPSGARLVVGPSPFGDVLSPAPSASSPVPACHAASGSAAGS